MKILVTGATGFIGHYVINELLKQKHTVIATSTSIEKARLEDWFDKVSYVEHNIHVESDENLIEKFQNPDILIHLAWANLSNFKDQIHVDVVLGFHKAFLRNLISNGLNDLTVTGTCLEYGMQEGELTEKLPSQPTIAYPIAKNQLRLYLEELQKTQHFSFKWVRLFYMYGKGQSPKSILSLLEKALQANEPSFNMSYGEQVRDYLPVNKVSENIIIFALQKKVEGIINCCSNEPIKIVDLVKNYLKEKNKTIHLNLGYYPYTDYEPMKFWGRNSKLKTVLND